VLLCVQPTEEHDHATGLRPSYRRNRSVSESCSYETTGQGSASQGNNKRVRRLSGSQVQVSGAGPVRRRANSFGSGRIVHVGGGGPGAAPGRRRRLNSAGEGDAHPANPATFSSKARVNFNLSESHADQKKDRSLSKSPARSALKSALVNKPDKS